MKALILSAIVLLAFTSVTFASTQYDPYNVNDFSSTVNQFISIYSAELASLSLAAIAALGIRIALKKAPGAFEDNQLNGITVALTMGIFVMVYVTGAYLLFAPLISLLIITGIGFVIFNVREGMKGAGDDLIKLADLITGFGCFLLGALALYIGGNYAAFMAMILFIMGIIFIAKGIKFGSLGTTPGTGSGGVTYNPKCPNCGSPLNPDGTCPYCNLNEDQTLDGQGMNINNALDYLYNLAGLQKKFKTELSSLFNALYALIIFKMKIFENFRAGPVGSILTNPNFLLIKKNIADFEKIILTIWSMLNIKAKKVFNEKIPKQALELAKKFPYNLKYKTKIEVLAKQILNLLPKEINFINSLMSSYQITKNPIRNRNLEDIIIVNGANFQLYNQIYCKLPGFGTSKGLMTIFSATPPYKGLLSMPWGSQQFLDYIQTQLTSTDPQIRANLIMLLSVISSFSESLKEDINDLLNLEKAIILPNPDEEETYEDEDDDGSTPPPPPPPPPPVKLAGGIYKVWRESADKVETIFQSNGDISSNISMTVWDCSLKNAHTPDTQGIPITIELPNKAEFNQLTHDDINDEKNIFTPPNNGIERLNKNIFTQTSLLNTPLIIWPVQDGIYQPGSKIGKKGLDCKWNDIILMGGPDKKALLTWSSPYIASGNLNTIKNPENPAIFPNNDHMGNLKLLLFVINNKNRLIQLWGDTGLKIKLRKTVLDNIDKDHPIAILMFVRKNTMTGKVPYLDSDYEIKLFEDLDSFYS